MSSNVERPIVFPLSNPTSSAECTAEQAYNWSEGRCIFASGSPFDPIYDEISGEVKMSTSQCNNMFIFPGLGLGATLCGSKKITDRMLYIAAAALAEFVSEEQLKTGKVFPNVQDIRSVSKHVACAVIREAFENDLTTRMTKKNLENLEEYVGSKMYNPVYVPLVEKPFFSH